MKNKKILAILGSPHPKGITATMLDHAVNSAQKAGYEITKINLYEKKIAYCIGCRYCLNTGVCVQKDDILEITSLLKACDVVILAAPVYWGNVPGILKNLFDRFLGVAMEETNTFPKPRLSGKKYMILTACKTPYPFSSIYGQSSGIIRNIDEFFKTAGMKSRGKFICTNTAKKTEPSKSLLKKIDRAVNKLG